MLVIRNSQGVTLEGIRLIGSIAKPPSAAIVFDQQPGSANEINLLRNIYIGQWQFDDQPGQQFDSGIVFSGINGNNGQNYGEQIWINGAGTGIDFQHGQYGLNQFHDIEIWNSGSCAVQNATRVRFTQAFFFHSGKADLCGSAGPSRDGAPDFELDYWGSEQSARLADFAVGGSPARLILHNGYFIAWGGHAENDGKFILVPPALQGWFGEITDFTLAYADYKGAPPLIDISHEGLGRIRQLIIRTGPHSNLSADNIVYSGSNSPGDFDFIDFVSDQQSFRVMAGLGFPTLGSRHPDPTRTQVANSVASKFIGGSGKPSIQAGAGAGSAGRCEMDQTANDSFGEIGCTVGASAVTKATVATVTFASAQPYRSAHCSLTAVSPDASQIYGKQAVMLSPSSKNTSGFTINSGEVGLAPGTYAWTYTCGE
jgi:hypothetical protein